MNAEHAARVLAYQRAIARVQGRLIRYSHPDDPGELPPASVRISQPAAGAGRRHARPTDDRGR